MQKSDSYVFVKNTKCLCSQAHQDVFMSCNHPCDPAQQPT